jgi:chromosome partitioning protein
MPSFTIAVANSKGGCSKTTTSMLLASALSRLLSVAVADSDPQGTASLWAAVGKFPCPVVPVAGDADIRALGAQFSAVIVDCPPNVASPVMKAALDNANLVVVPCAPEPADVWATTILLEKCRREYPQLRVVVVLTKVPAGTALARDTLGSIEQAGWPLARARLGLRTAYKEAMALGSTLAEVRGPGAIKARAEVQELALEAMTILSTLGRES